MRARSVSAALVAIAATGCGGDASHGSAQDTRTVRIRTVDLPRGTWPRSVAVDARGVIWTAETSADAVAELERGGGIVQHKLGDATQTSLSDLAFADDGNLWFAGFQLVGWITPDGRVSGYQLGFNGRGRPEVGLPSAMTKGPDGNAWYTSEGSPAAVKRVTADGTIRTYPLPESAGASGFGGIAAGPDGALWFTQTAEIGDAREAIGRLDPDTGYTRFPLPGGRAGVGRITAGPDGAMWFTERARYRIATISTDGEVDEYPLPVGTVPAEIIAGSDGALWFTTPHAVGRMTTTGQVKLWPIPGATGLWGIAQAPDGAIWVTDPEADLLRRVVPPAP